MKDEFKRAMHDGKYSYCPCCNDDPPKSKARRKLRDATRKELLEYERTQQAEDA